MASLCQIAAVSVRMRCMTRAMTPPGEQAQVGTGMAEPFGLGGVAEYGLHRGEGDQFGIAQAGRKAGRRAPRRQSG